MFVKKKMPIKKRLNLIDEELRALRKNVQPRKYGHAKNARAPETASEAPEPGAPDRDSESEPYTPEEGKLGKYLAHSSLAGQPLRYAKRSQRNKAVVMAVFVFLVFLWALHRMLN